MSELLKAADELGKLDKMFSAMNTIRPFLSQVGSLEQAAKEARAVLDRQSKELAALKADEAAAKEGVKRAKDEAAAVLRAATAEAAGIVASAKATKAAADAEAKAIRDSAAGHLAAEQAKEKGELESLTKRKTAVAAELADIEGRTAKARVELRKLAEA